MGYYSGNGAVVGGGHSIRQFGSLIYNGAHIVMQKTISSTTKKAGVSLDDAQSETSSLSLGTSTFSWANLYPWVGCRGTEKTVTYSRIGDSNLYELFLTNSTMYASGDGGATWIGPDA